MDNCRNRSIRLTFGDMTKKVNAFNLGKQSYDMDNLTFKVNLTENLTNEHNEDLELEAECEFELESKDYNLDQIVESVVN